MILAPGPPARINKLFHDKPRNAGTCSRRSVCLLLFCFAVLPLAAQEHDSARYILSGITVTVNGRTRPDAVLRYGDFVIGETFSGKAALDNYITQKKQLLMNNRALARAGIEYTLEPNGDDSYLVSLTILLTDTRNFIILPEPKFSSNTGFTPSIKIRDYNFLGALVPLKTDIGYSLDEFHLDDASKGIYSLEVEAVMPFRALALDWNLNFLLSLGYTAGEPLSIGNTTGLAVNIPYKTARFTIGVELETRFGEEYYSFEKGRHSNIFEPVRYITPRTYLSMLLPLGISTVSLGELFWKPRLAAQTALGLGGADIGGRRGPVWSFTNALGFDHVNWRGNFREGAVIMAQFANEYNSAFNTWNNNITVTGTKHGIVTDFFAYSLRGRYKIWFNRTGWYRDIDRLEAGNMLRGILDRSIAASNMVSLNIDLPLRVLRFMPSEWFNTQKLRYFNFEMQLAPILDIAFIDGELLDRQGYLQQKLGFNFDSFFITGGIEALVFPLSWRSIFLRVSIGWNLRTALGGAEREIFIGIGHYY